MKLRVNISYWGLLVVSHTRFGPYGVSVLRTEHREVDTWLRGADVFKRIVAHTRAVCSCVQKYVFGRTGRCPSLLFGEVDSARISFSDFFNFHVIFFSCKSVVRVGVVCFDAVDMN